MESFGLKKDLMVSLKVVKSGERQETPGARQPSWLFGTQGSTSVAYMGMAACFFFVQSLFLLVHIGFVGVFFCDFNREVFRYQHGGFRGGLLLPSFCLMRACTRSLHRDTYIEIHRDTWKVRAQDLCLMATIAINEGERHGVWAVGEYLCRVLPVRRVHPELLGVYPLPKCALRRANTLATKIAQPQYNRHPLHNLWNGPWQTPPAAHIS